MIVLDACVLIAHLESTDLHHDRATRLLVDLADEPLGASQLTLAEVLVGPARTGEMDTVQGALRTLDVTPIALPEDAPARLAALRAGTRLRLPDCCVLLAAQDAEGAVATFDDRLAAAASTLGLAVHS
jgi:predicted nucleic acid-binding protein